MVDNDRVHVGDVEAALDDGGAQQHVVLALGKPQHHLGQLILVHLPMADHHRRLGHDAT